MTQLVTVQTDFRDLEQMAEGLVGRVHATHVILPAGDSVDEGEWAQFAIALYDGSSGLAGIGRCVTVVDNGAEREAHQRFDVVFDSLQFDDHEQRVFEHILALHGTGGQQIEEISDAESLRPQAIEETGNNYVDVSTEFTGSQRVELDADLDADVDSGELPEEQTQIAHEHEFEALVDAAPVPAPGGSANDAAPHMEPVHHHAAVSYGHAQSAAVAHAVAHAQPVMIEDMEEPLSGERIAPRQVNGSAFAYANGIPFPAKPPRPELDPSMRVTPAPRPAGTGH
jgi:hypothetical protein